MEKALSAVAKVGWATSIFFATLAQVWSEIVRYFTSQDHQYGGPGGRLSLQSRHVSLQWQSLQ